MVELRRVVVASAYCGTGRHVGTRAAAAARGHGRVLVAVMVDNSHASR